MRVVEPLLLLRRGLHAAERLPGGIVGVPRHIRRVRLRTRVVVQRHPSRYAAGQVGRRVQDLVPFEAVLWVAAAALREGFDRLCRGRRRWLVPRVVAIHREEAALHAGLPGGLGDGPVEQILRREVRIGAGLCRVLAVPHVTGEEPETVAADGAAEVRGIVHVLRLGEAGRARRASAGQRDRFRNERVWQEPRRRGPLEPVRPRLGDDVEDRALRVRVFGGGAERLHLDFFRGLAVRPRPCPAAAQVVEDDAVDLERVVVGGRAKDRHPGVTLADWIGRDDARRELHLVEHREPSRRDLLDRFLVDRRRHADLAGVHDGARAADRDRFGQCRQRELHDALGRAVDEDAEVRFLVGGKAGQVDPQRVGARRQRHEAVLSAGVGDRIRRSAGRRRGGHRDRRARQYRARFIAYGADDATGQDLRGHIGACQHPAEQQRCLAQPHTRPPIQRCQELMVRAGRQRASRGRRCVYRGEVRHLRVSARIRASAM